MPRKKTSYKYYYFVAFRTFPNNITSGKQQEPTIDMFYEMKGSDFKKLRNTVFNFNNPINPFDPITMQDCMELNDLSLGDLPQLDMMQKRCRSNPGITLHLFKTDFKCREEDFKVYIILKDPTTKKLLKDSRIF